MKNFLLLGIVMILSTSIASPQNNGIIYLPDNYKGEPIPILYWLHWHNGSYSECPIMKNKPNFIIVAPAFRRKADWESFDLLDFIREVEKDRSVTARYIEGYSKGANGALWHANFHPHLFDKVTCIAGNYDVHFEPPENLTMIAGTRDEHLQASLDYCTAMQHPLILVDSSHDPEEFYNKLDWEKLYE